MTKQTKKECKCACHDNKLKKPYEHTSRCCAKMNGYLEPTSPKEDYYISEETKKTAKHIGIMSEGAIQTLIDETFLTAKKEARKELIEEIEKIIEKEAGFYYRDASCGNSSEVTAIELVGLRKGLKKLQK